MTSCTPDICNIRRVLVWEVKVKFVRQIVVFKKQKNKRLFACSFPVRPASGTVSLINRFMNIFDEMEFGRSWNMALGLRNPSQKRRQKLRLELRVGFLERDSYTQYSIRELRLICDSTCDTVKTRFQIKIIYFLLILIHKIVYQCFFFE